MWQKLLLVWRLCFCVECEAGASAAFNQPSDSGALVLLKFGTDRFVQKETTSRHGHFVQEYYCITTVTVSKRRQWKTAERLHKLLWCFSQHVSKHVHINLKEISTAEVKQKNTQQVNLVMEIGDLCSDVKSQTGSFDYTHIFVMDFPACLCRVTPWRCTWFDSSRPRSCCRDCEQRASETQTTPEHSVRTAHNTIGSD